MSDELSFSGNEVLIIDPIYKSIFNNFTYEFWIKPQVTHEITKEAISGEYGNHGGKYVISPYCVGDKNSSGMGISVGTNGVSVYEHSINYFPALLVHECKITEWTHIVIVYKNKTPSLYINGLFIKKGLTSNMDFIFPSGILGGCNPYGFFQGALKNIRLWKRPLESNQVKSLMNDNMVHFEKDLIWGWNQSENAVTQLSDKRDIEISVIIPSYNKYPQNLFTLFSLENQTFDTSKMEVIFIDDNSTDSTESAIVGYPFPYLLKYIKCEKNGGRARARNLGIKAASGKVIIFLDAEILVEKNFIKKHYLTHQENPNSVVSAVMQLKGIYSVIFKDFEQKQLDHFYNLINENVKYLKKWNSLKDNKECLEMITKEDILKNNFQDLTFSKPLEKFYEEELLQYYGDLFSGFHFPWLAFMSGNVSVRKEMLDKAGYFDENFEGYGWEDIELGYRLYLTGVNFLNQKYIQSYHQEHPVTGGNMNQARKNYQLFQKKHQVIDVYLLVLLEIEKDLTFKDINNILIDYKKLCKEHPNQYNVLKNTFKLMLKELGDCLANNKLSENVLKEIVMNSHTQLNIEKKYLQQNNQYEHLTMAFNILENL
ncbi:glycosyltransferase [Priestia megaterium]|uniref:glycosyltransferase n=1 Tax=Priestia megaterium TaxID=1404 RepID=UPI0021D64BBD|nr:glycosyltransferase [Priestia megaterium]MCU7741457.1 glycosyltransferase [Priestia megaterium]